MNREDANSRLDDVLLVAGGAFIGLLTCISIQSDCFGLPDMSDGRAELGTARAQICAPVDHWFRWILLPLIAMALAYGMSRLLRGITYSRWLSAAFVVLVGVGYVLAAHRLSYFTPI
jgi:hypothetical protein